MPIEERSPDPQFEGGELRRLVIVARNQPDLWRSLRKDFEASQNVLVLVDRRVSERRQQCNRYEPNRRRFDRRRPLTSDIDVSSRQYIIVRPKQRMMMF